MECYFIKFKCYYIFPGFYPSTATKVEAAVVKDEAAVPATAGLTTQSVVRVSAEKNLVYYSAGNKLYAYNVLSGGNFPQNALTNILVMQARPSPTCLSQKGAINFMLPQTQLQDSL